MSERHKYEYVVDPEANTAAAKVIRMVGMHKRTLEIGAGPGSITRWLKDPGKCRITAIEIDEAAIEKLKEFCERVYKCDLNTTSWASLVSEQGKFQVIVAADVLEHLYDPWATLSTMRSILTEDGYIVVSLPHIGHNAVIGCLLDGDFEYQEWGLLDRTHIRFFSIRNIQKLFEQSGLKIVEAEFVVRPPDQTEFARQWRKLSPELRRELEKNKFGTAYQVVVKAVPTSAQGRALNLVSLSVPDTNSGMSSKASLKSRVIYLLKKIARNCLSMNMRSRISNMLNRLGIRL